MRNTSENDVFRWDVRVVSTVIMGEHWAGCPEGLYGLC